MSDYTDLTLRREGAVATLTLERPRALNALDEALMRELLRVVRDIRRDGGVRALVITGGGEKAFSAGADIAAMAAMAPGDGHAYARLGHEVMSRLEALELPVIAAVNGVALGGGLELALACDLIVATERARLGQPEINLGLIPGFGGTQRLVRRVGVGRARELILPSLRWRSARRSARPRWRPTSTSKPAAATRWRRSRSPSAPTTGSKGCGRSSTSARRSGRGAECGSS
jgi:enoyl-CoA hydratase